jgi:hypothetical protein
MKFKLLTKSNSYELIKGDEIISNGILEIPSSYNSLPVTEVGSDAFKENKNLIKIIFPNTINTIGVSAFESCKKLNTIVFSPLSKITIGARAFRHCNSLKSMQSSEAIEYIGSSAFEGCGLVEITLPNLMGLFGSSTFSACYSLKRVDLGQHITEIETGTFSDCKSIDSINLPTNLLSISPFAFANCESLIKIEIPSSVNNIGHRAFLGCNSLKELTLPENIEIIEEATFLNCQSLKEINLSSKTKVISDLSFMDCVELKKINFHSEIIKIGSSAFENCKSLVVPKNLSKFELGKDAFKGCISTEKQIILNKTKLLVTRSQKLVFELFVPNDFKITDPTNYDKLIADLKRKGIKSKPKLIEEKTLDSIININDKFLDNLNTNNLILFEFQRIFNKFKTEDFSSTINELARIIHEYQNDYALDYLPDNYRKKFFTNKGTKKSPEYVPIEELTSERYEVEYKAIKDYILDIPNSELLNWLTQLDGFIGT